MDLRNCENILKIAEYKSITKAAQQLFITQSALNQQLEKLETELGTPLFKRNRSNWQLTQAGEVYVEAARNLLQIKKDAYNRIHDIADIQNRTIMIGLIPERGVNMFTAIYPGFHSVFPDTILEPVETNVQTMQKQITAGDIDLGLMTLNRHQRDDNDYRLMAEEEIFLAVPATHPMASAGSPIPEQAPDIALRRFCGDSFITIVQHSTMHELEQSLFAKAGFEPHVLFSTSSNVSKYRMVASGVGCALLPQVFAIPEDSVRFFRLQEHPTWEITMCCRRNAVLSRAEEYFLELCKDYWGCLNS